MVHRALDAAAQLAKDGVEVEVIDLRTLSPLDIDTVIESVEKTGRLVCVDEANPRCSIAADVAAQVAQSAFGALKGPIQMVEGVVQLKHGNPADQGGSSGGAWIGKFDGGNNNDANYIISVESFGIDGQPGIDYGPYLNDDFKSLWDYGENGCQ